MAVEGRMEKNRALLLKYAVFLFNIIAVLGISIFLWIATEKICDTYVASEFMGRVEAIPSHPRMIVAEMGILLFLLVLSFIGREYFFQDNPIICYSSIAFDLLISLIIIYLLDFNYNGILLWVFANLISHIKELKGKYVLIVVSLASYIGTDHGIVSVSSRLYYIKDYIGLYEGIWNKVLLWTYNVILSLNVILFLMFCVYIIMDQSGTITEVRRLYQQLSETNRELQGANVKLREYAVIKEKMGETKERNRLAREIHDTLGHTLTGISAGVDACIAMIDLSPEATKTQLDMIAQVTRDGIKEVRRSVSELRPDALDRLSLEHAIKKMVKETNSMTSTRIDFCCEVDVLKFDEDEENAIYRVIQESITNSIRHGNAKHVQIELTKKDSDIHLLIRDDGIGCKDMKKGFGTRHIVERIRMLNGEVWFSGENGFTTKVIIPIRWGENYD